MSSTPQNPKSTPSSHWPDTSSSNQHPTTHPSSMDFTSQPHFSITHQRPIEKFSNVACGKCYLSHGKLKRKGQHWVTIKEDNRSNLIWIMWSKKIEAECKVYSGLLWSIMWPLWLGTAKIFDSCSYLFPYPVTTRNFRVHPWWSCLLFGPRCGTVIEGSDESVDGWMMKQMGSESHLGVLVLGQFFVYIPFFVGFLFVDWSFIVD